MAPADYVYKLWLAHGVTTVREMGCFRGLDWVEEQRDDSAANRIAAPRIRAHGLRELDGAAIRLRAPRRLTQEISRYVYEQTTPRGTRAFDGISYLSRLGDEFRNWALFEPHEPSPMRPSRSVTTLAAPGCGGRSTRLCTIIP